MHLHQWKTLSSPNITVWAIMGKWCENLRFKNAERTVYKLFRISREREPSLGSGGVRECFDYHLELDNSNERVKDAFLKFVLPFYKCIY